MKKENRDLLESLIGETLKNASGKEDENYKALEAAMKLIDRQLELDKQALEIEKLKMAQEHDINRDEAKHQYELENENNRKDHEFNLEIIKQKFKLKEANITKKIEEAKLKFENDKDARDKLIKAGEIALMLVVSPLIEAGCKKAFAKMICDFEKDYNFTTMAGKGLSSIFKFRR